MNNSNNKKVALVLSGCGVFDGSEIQEAVLSILALQKANAQITYFAPDSDFDVVNHNTSSPQDEKRNVLIESARIARGNVHNLATFNADDFDAIVFPGGFGAAKNLCTFAFDGVNCSVNKDVEKAIMAMLNLKKPMGFLCISPVIPAKLIGNAIKLSLGLDDNNLNTLNAMNATALKCSSDSFVEDENFNVYSTPAYMNDANLAQIQIGIEAMINKMLK